MSGMAAPATVLITGAAQRIGRILAMRLAADGWRVGVHCRGSRQEALQLAAEIAGNGGAAAVLEADLADAAQVETLIPACIAALGPPTCLINNASTFIYDTVASLDPKVWDMQLAVNVKAPVFLSRAFAAGLPEGETGNIVNIVDQR